MKKYKATVQKQYTQNNSPNVNDEFESLSDSYSVSDIQHYIEYIIKRTKHHPLILIFIFKSKDLIRLVFKMKGR